MDFSNMEVTIDHIADAGAKIKAYATVTFDGMFKVHGVRLAESKQGLNIFMPQKAFNKNGKTLYTDVFHPITSGARAALKEAVIDVEAFLRGEIIRRDVPEREQKNEMTMQL